MLKSQIAEKCKRICELAKDLKGASDNWEFKEYVLGFVFYRYISENLANFINQIQQDSGDHSFDYHREIEREDIWLENRDEIINTKGYFISPKNLFKNVFERFNLSSDKDNLNREMKTVFDEISSSSKNDLFYGLFEKMDFGDDKLGETGKEKGKKILELFDAIQKMEFRFKDSSGKEIDIYGIAYESLIGMYASSIQKKGKDFYTPKEISETLIRLASVGERDIRRVYDPACGSGSLLLKFLNNEKAEKIKFYGQEINPVTYNLCRMNMFLHNVPYHQFQIMKGDTLVDNKLDLKIRFDAVVSNPPYSEPWDIAGNENRLLNDERFIKAGVLAPKSKGDLAFIMHSLYYLEEKNGVASILCFPGILYRGGKEKKIREYLINQNYVDAIIHLSQGLFFGVGIDTCIMVLKKNKPDGNVFFIDASEQFEKIKNINRLNEENIKWIVDTYKNKQEIKGYSRMVEKIEIQEKDFNLSLNAYIRRESEKKEIDIEELEREIKMGAERINKLRSEIDELVKTLKQ